MYETSRINMWCWQNHRIKKRTKLHKTQALSIGIEHREKNKYLDPRTPVCSSCKPSRRAKVIQDNCKKKSRQTSRRLTKKITLSVKILRKSSEYNWIKRGFKRQRNSPPGSLFKEKERQMQEATQLDKEIFKKPIANIIPNDKNFDGFMLRNNAKMSPFTTAFQHYGGSPSQCAILETKGN